MTCIWDHFLGPDMYAWPPYEQYTCKATAFRLLPGGCLVICAYLVLLVLAGLHWALESPAVPEALHSFVFAREMLRCPCETRSSWPCRDLTLVLTCTMDVSRMGSVPKDP